MNSPNRENSKPIGSKRFANRNKRNVNGSIAYAIRIAFDVILYRFNNLFSWAAPDERNDYLNSTSVFQPAALAEMFIYFYVRYWFRLVYVTNYNRILCLLPRFVDVFMQIIPFVDFEFAIAIQFYLTISI